MNELSIGNETGLDLEGLTDEELDFITTKALYIKTKKIDEKIDKKFIELENTQKKLAEGYEQHDEKINETSEELKKTQNFINVLGFSTNSYKFSLLKKIATRRVYELLNDDPASIEFLVWSKYFFIKIYSDIAHHFKVNKCANINIEYFEEACEIAKYWTPSDYYIKEKIDEMKKKSTTGLLKQERVMALHIYLESTNGGRINPFTV